MKSEAILIIIGGLLILIGIIGGGFTVKEVTLPKIPNPNRILATIIGLILMGTGMYLAIPLTPGGKPSDFSQEISGLKEKIANITKKTIESSEQRQEKVINEATKQISQTPNQIEEQTDTLNKLDAMQKKILEEAIKQMREQLINELEKSKKDIEHKSEYKTAIIENEKRRMENAFNQSLEKRIAEINNEWKIKMEITQAKLRNLQQEKKQEQEQEQEQEQAEQKRRIADEDAKRKAAAQDLIREYWIAVGKRDTDTAIEKWDNPSIQKQSSLKSLINVKEYLNIKDIRVDNYEKDNALISFTVIYKDKNSLEKHGVGTFKLKFIDNSWKIINITSWTTK